MKDYISEITKLNDEIISKEGIYDAYLSVRYIIENDINKVSFSFPDSVKNYLENGQRFELYFRFNKESIYINGYNKMFFSENMLSSKIRELSNYNFLKNSILKKTNVFIFSELGYLHFVLLEIIDSNYKLRLMMPNGASYVMNITIEGYMEFLMLTRGMFLGEAYLCPNFPKELLVKHYDGFYSNMELLFNITPDQLPQCFHKDIVSNTVPFYNQYEKNLFKEFQRIFADDIDNKTCSISPPLSSPLYNRVFPIWFVRAIELNIHTSLPKSYKQLIYDFGYDRIKFSRTTADNQFISIEFLNVLNDVFWNNKSKDFSNDANLFIYKEKGKVPEFNDIRLFAISGEHKFGMHIIEEDNIEIVMIDSVENTRLVQMPEHIRTMDGFIGRFLETKGEFLLNEIPI